MFYPLKISKIISEIPEAKTFFFEVPHDLKDQFQFTAGQYLTLKTEVNGEDLRRCYSICTVPDHPEMGVTVKSVYKGRMSQYLNHHVREGDTLEVMPPQGLFKIKTDHSLRRQHVFIAAGSGITPVISMIQVILEEEPKSTCLLIYANRNENSIIFKEKLEQLTHKYAGQLTVEHVLSQPLTRKEGKLGGLFSKTITDWKGYSGRLNSTMLKEILEKNNISHNAGHFYLCGPAELMDMATEYLLNNSVPKKQIHKESFGSVVTEGEPSSHQPGQVKVHLRGEDIILYVEKGQTILDALIQLKKDPPYSCTSGACSTCMAKVTQGKVSMTECYALEEDEIEAGYILTCQSHPQTTKVEITFDV